MIQPRNPDEYVTQENIDAKTADLASALSFDGPAAEYALNLTSGFKFSRNPSIAWLARD